MYLKEELLTKIKENKVKVGIIGLGYVGLPLAVTFAKAGITVLGFDTNRRKVELIEKGENYIKDIKDEDLKKVVAGKHLNATDDARRISECDAIIICVPTPLDKFK